MKDILKNCFLTVEAIAYDGTQACIKDLEDWGILIMNGHFVKIAEDGEIELFCKVKKPRNNPPVFVKRKDGMIGWCRIKTFEKQYEADQQGIEP